MRRVIAAAAALAAAAEAAAPLTQWRGAVVAREEWNDVPGAVLSAGASYTVAADPPDQTWTDLAFTCDADGYTNAYIRLFTPLLRFKGQNFFKLICCVGTRTVSDANCMPVGVSSTFVSPAAGQLSCFANDVAGIFYKNNFGSINVTAQPA
eukprot:TRINITY_DN28025_c0_g1_i1.p2 TRINITY_DN28025_c0_g1~~TRINITY_DN28025_c0_g1_i1.p2  ORF type:complete len:151 (+),score=42.59 TRINITY_DN28025_c0_g1_i1:80-532(+)